MKARKFRIKYLLLLIIAMGMSMSILVGLEYKCFGDDVFPEFYASPFVFKKQNLGSSMEYYYGLSGLLANTLIWYVFLFLMNLVLLKICRPIKEKRLFKIPYLTIVFLLLGCSVFSLFISYLEMAQGFGPNQHYWYINMDQEIQYWHMNCKGEWKFFTP